MASRCAPHSAASPPHRMTRPRWQCSGSRPGAAPIPPSASLPEDRYRPVNTALDSAAGSWHSARLSILSPRARHATRTRTHPPAPRTREPKPRGVLHKRFQPAHTRTRASYPATRLWHERARSLHARTRPPAADGEHPVVPGTSEPADPTRKKMNLTACRRENTQTISCRARPNPSRPPMRRRETSPGRRPDRPAPRCCRTWLRSSLVRSDQGLANYS